MKVSVRVLSGCDGTILKLDSGEIHQIQLHIYTFIKIHQTVHLQRVNFMV